MNQMTFQAIGWLIGSAVLLALSVALVVSAKRQSGYTDKFGLQALAAFVLLFALFSFGLGWQSLSVGLFGGTK